MIDIHTHIIPFVDDGCKSIEKSIEMIRHEIENGVTDIICTPHYRRRLFDTPIEDIKKNFDLLVEEVKSQKLDVRLYLGHEIYVDTFEVFLKYYSESRIMPLNETDFYLLEFPTTRIIDISEIIFNVKLLFKKTVVAHVERYKYLSLDDIYDIKLSRCLVQVNASSVVGKSGYFTKRKVFKMIKYGYVDIVATDIHESRKNYFKKAFNVVKKKFGLEKANELFYSNCLELIDRDYKKPQKQFKDEIEKRKK